MSSIMTLRGVLEKSSTLQWSSDPSSIFFRRADETKYAPGKNGIIRSMMRLISEARVLASLRLAKDDGTIIDFGKQTENPQEVYSYGFDFWYITPDRNIHTIEVKSSFFNHGAADVDYDSSDNKGFKRPSQFAEHVVVARISRHEGSWECDLEVIIDNHHFDEAVVKGNLGSCIACPYVKSEVYAGLVERNIIVPIRR